MIEHLKTLMSIGPHTAEQASVHQALEYCLGVLRGAGWQAEIMDVDGVSSLYAHPLGVKQSKLLLHAHVDVVSAPNYGANVDESLISGRGCYDMLFAVASYLQFAQDHKQSRDQLDVAIMITGDEEIGGRQGTGYLLNNGYSTDVCVMPDAGERFGELSIAAKGACQLLLHVSGESHHASRPWEGDGAAAKLVALLHQFQQYFADQGHDDSTLTVSMLRAGESFNQGPGMAEAVVDIRYRNQAALSTIKQHLSELLKRYDADSEELLTAADYRIDINNPYINSFLELYRGYTDDKITTAKAHGSSDAHYFINHGTPVIMLRPDGGDAHGDDEWLDIDSWRQFHQLIEEYILETATIEN